MVLVNIATDDLLNYVVGSVGSSYALYYSLNRRYCYIKPLETHPVGSGSFETSKRDIFYEQQSD